MTTGVLLTPPVIQFFGNNGLPAVNGSVLTQVGGVNAATYQDVGLTTPLPNPIPLNSRGEVSTSNGVSSQCFLTPNTVYTFTLYDGPNGSGNQVWAASYVNGVQLTTAAVAAVLTQSIVGAALYQLTAAEISSSVMPTNFFYNGDSLDPRRYGAVGDGVTDDTIAINKWITVWNATTAPASVWPTGLTFLCGLLNNMTAANGTWTCFSTLLSKSNTMAGGSSWISVAATAANLRIFGLTMNGNQAAYTAGAGNAMMYFNQVANLVLEACSFVQSSEKGCLFFQVAGAQISNCHFDSNANLGVEFNAASYMKFVDCTVNFNGYGFQKTFATNTFAAFGSALRFRSHHITWMSCDARINGRDGLCTNQGSYAIKYIGCLAYMNGDGGFTIASDNTGSGLPGEAEACYDLEYIDCEAYNNWSSGLSAYNACYNVTVDGGRYYNNNRLAGTQTLASAYFSGVYITQSSQGIRVRTKAYDDRQMCPITVSSGNTVNATGWVNGTMGSYPRVAFYNANMVFQGYGTITAEASPNVSYSTTAYNGVTVANVVPGWFITQRVQHNGVFFDNGAQGEIDVDGFGFLSGPAGYSGFKSVVGYLGNGQNVLLPGTGLDYTELLANPTWDAGVTNWTFNPSGGTGAGNYYTTAGTGLRSPGSLQLVGGSQGIVGDGTLVTSALAYAQGCYVEASVWVNAQAPLDASIFLFWNPGTGSLYSIVSHPGGGWKQLKIGIFVPAGNTSLTFRMQSSIGKTNYFDNASLRVKFDKTDQRDYTYPSRNLPV